uniref:Uncharacterized protein n=1 Tax=Acrobeloides nanus TaxID=290746 RepID=A0A914DAB9_9BILA
MYTKSSTLLLLAIVHIILLLISEAKPTFSWSHELDKSYEKRAIEKHEDDSVHPTPSVSYQKSSPLKNQGVTPAVENQKRARNFFGVSHEHETFKPSKYEKNCFFSPVNCVVYRSKINGVNVILRRAES